jgi:hypothetical protein
LGNGVPNTKNKFETLRFYAFTAPGSRLAPVDQNVDCGIQVERCARLSITRVEFFSPGTSKTFTTFNRS